MYRMYTSGTKANNFVMVSKAINFLGDFPTCFSFTLSNPQHRRFHNQAKPGKRFFGPPPPRRWHILPTNQPSIQKSSRISLRRGRKIFSRPPPFPPLFLPSPKEAPELRRETKQNVSLPRERGGRGRRRREKRGRNFVAWGKGEGEKSHTLTQDVAFLASNARRVSSTPLFQSIQSTKLGLLSICRPTRKRQVWRPGSVGIH